MLHDDHVWECECQGCFPFIPSLILPFIWARTDPPCGTHQDADQRRAGGRVLGQADVVHGLAEDGPVVVLVDEIDEDAGEADVVRHGLVGVELGRGGTSGVKAMIVML